MTEVTRAVELRLEPIGGPRTEPFVLSGQGPAVIGRAQDCAVCLPDVAVSRRHASLTVSGGRWLLTDLDSRHGTFLNGIRLQSQTPAIAAAGDLIRVGCHTLRLAAGGVETGAFATTDDSASPGTIVERVPRRELDSLAHRRLDLLIDGAAVIHQAADEESLARAVLELTIAGTGFARAAILRHTGSSDRVEVLISRDVKTSGSGSFSFSRSLLREAACGHVARLSQTSGQDYGQSIDQLGITCAVAAPIVLDASVVGYIYVDSRELERPGDVDAAGFCHAVARLAGLALSSLKRAALESRQKQLDADLKAAQLAQSFLCPKEAGAVGALFYAAQTCPGRVVAGDLFDIFQIDEQRVAVCCGDVTGQGMGAAILMTAVLSHLRAALARYGEPAQAVNDVNRYISQRSPSHMFASLWAGVLDQGEGVLHYVDAGHGHWLLRRHDKPPTPAPRPNGLLIGIDLDHHYSAESLELEKGDRVVLYSDGIVEHRNLSGEDFGHQRLLEAIAKSDSAERDVADALAALRAFIGDAGLADDTTIASIEFRGTSDSAGE